MVYTIYPNIQPTVDRAKRMISVQDFPASLAPLNHHEKYLKSRGIESSKISEYSAYYCEDGICYILYGAFGYQVRVTNDTQQSARRGAGLRFLFPSGVSLRSALYAPARTRFSGKELIVVEGTTDALAVAQLGYRTVSLLGSSVTPEKVAAIKGLLTEMEDSILYMIPDNDLPGQKAAEKLCEGGLYPRLLYLPSYAKDICDLDIVYRHEFLQERIIG